VKIGASFTQRRKSNCIGNFHAYCPIWGENQSVNNAFKISVFVVKTGQGRPYFLMAVKINYI